MKNLLLIANLFLFITLFIGCGTKTKNETAPELDDEIELSGLCIWKEVSIKETPSEKGKYLSTIYLGERFEVLADTASELVKEKRYKYYKVKLTDGTEGWTMSQFVALNATPAAFVKDALVYKRPDLMTATKKSFNTLDFVAALNKNADGWVEVIGKRVGDTWFTSGWVKNENLTYGDKDVIVAVLHAKVMEVKDVAARETEIRSLIMNSELYGSTLHSFMKAKHTERLEENNVEALIDSAASN